MSPAKRKPTLPPPAQPTAKDEFEREMLEAARMLGHLMGEALLSAYRTIKARQSMEEAAARASQEADDRIGLQESGEDQGAEVPTVPKKHASALLTVSEAAAILGIGRSSFYSLVQRKEVPVLRIGKSVRIVPRELEEWIQEHSTRAQLGQQDLSMFGPKPGRR